MDPEVDANCLWHTFILLSRYDEKTKKIEVINDAGFYGPTASVKTGFLYKLKRLVGFDTDLSGNHRYMMHEELRYMDRGRGIHGVTFELTEENFNKLLQRLHNLRKDQKNAIREAEEELKLDTKSDSKTRCYSGEKNSFKIFQHELNKAEKEKRQPRLKEFSLNLFNSPKSCKTHAIDILKGILTDKQIQRIQGYWEAVTYFSGKLEPLPLHSRGPLYDYAKKGTKYRDFKYDANDNKDTKTQLFFSIIPQNMEYLSNDTKELFHIDSAYIDRIRKVVRDLQGIEYVLKDFTMSQKYSPTHDDLLKRVIQHYEFFSIVRTNVKKEKKGATRVEPYDFWKSLRTDSSNDLLDRELVEHLVAAEDFVQNLYAAIADDWEVNVTATLTNTEETNAKEDPYRDLLQAYTVDMKRRICASLNHGYTPIKESPTFKDADLEYAAQLLTEQKMLM